VDLRAEGDASEGGLRGEVRFVDSEVRSKIEVKPLLAATGTGGLDSEIYAQTFKNLAPSPNRSLDVGVGCVNPIRLTGQNLVGSIRPALRIQGTPENPLPIGEVVVEGLEFATNSALFIAERATLAFFPDKPWEPFVFAKASGFPSGFALDAFAFGPLTEGKWCLSTSDAMAPTPQSLFLLMRDSLAPAPVPSGQIAPSEFFLASRATDSLIPVALRIEDQSLTSSGLRFGDSMDFGLSGALLPMGSFEQGFEWKWAPAF
jgi:hypothetical protein